MAKETRSDTNLHSSRESWLKAAELALRPHFEGHGYPLPEKIRYSIAFTSQGRKGKATGQCIYPEASADDHFEIIIRSDRDDPMDVIGVLVHQLVHSVTSKRHDKRFHDAALKLGLNDKNGLVDAGPAQPLKHTVLNDLIVQLGPLPHGRVDFDLINLRGSELVADRKKKQVARMHKAECKSEGCGYTVRVAAKWLRVGKPHCPVHGEMFADSPVTVEAAT